MVYRPDTPEPVASEEALEVRDKERDLGVGEVEDLQEVAGKGGEKWIEARGDDEGL